MSEYDDEFVVDDPEQVTTSDDEEEYELKENVSKRTTRGRGRQPAKKKKVAKKPVTKKAPAKKSKKSQDSDEEEGGESDDDSKDESGDQSDQENTSGEVGTGTFLVLKNDFREKDEPPIWRIDGSTLLEKFLPQEVEGKKLYKNTASFAPWNVARKDRYYTAPVLFKQQSGNDRYVEFQRELVKKD